MGCGASLAQKRHDGGAAKVAPMGAAAMAAKNGARSPLTQDEINSRIVCSPAAVKASVTKRLAIQYAYVSQRGYYPDGK